MRQISIISQTKKKFDKLYLHELESNDIFAFNNNEIKRGVLYRVVENDFKLDSLNNYVGSISYTKIEYSNRLGKEVIKKKISKKPMDICFYIRTDETK